MYPHPHAKLRFVVDARWLYQKLPGGFAQRLRQPGPARVFADDLAVFDAVVFDHAAGDVGGCARWDAFDGGEIGAEFAVIRLAQPRHRIQLRAAGAEAGAHHALGLRPRALGFARPVLPLAGSFDRSIASNSDLLTLMKSGLGGGALTGLTGGSNGLGIGRHEVALLFLGHRRFGLALVRRSLTPIPRLSEKVLRPRFPASGPPERMLKDKIAMMNSASSSNAMARPNPRRRSSRRSQSDS